MTVGSTLTSTTYAPACFASIGSEAAGCTKAEVPIEKNKIAYAYAKVIEIDRKQTILEVTLYQGYNRQIRKMMDIIKHPVISLKRLSHANINLSGLKRGDYKYLKPKEVKELKNYIAKAEKQS